MIICITCVWYDPDHHQCTLLDIWEIDETDETITACEYHKPAPELN